MNDKGRPYNIAYFENVASKETVLFVIVHMPHQYPDNCTGPKCYAGKYYWDIPQFKRDVQTVVGANVDLTKVHLIAAGDMNDLGNDADPGEIRVDLRRLRRRHDQRASHRPALYNLLRERRLHSGPLRQDRHQQHGYAEVFGDRSKHLSAEQTSNLPGKQDQQGAQGDLWRGDFSIGRFGPDPLAGRTGQLTRSPSAVNPNSRCTR